MTDLVPSEVACLASPSGRMRGTAAVWISRDAVVLRDEIVDLEYDTSSGVHAIRRTPTQVHAVTYSTPQSLVICSKISFTKGLGMAIASLEIPVSGCTCLSTVKRIYVSFCSLLTKCRARVKSPWTNEAKTPYLYACDSPL